MTGEESRSHGDERSVVAVTLVLEGEGEESLTTTIAELAPFAIWALSGGRYPLALSVMQVLALDVGTDLLPALALGAEGPAAGVLDQPPITGHLVDRTILRGAGFGRFGPTEAIVEIAAFTVGLLVIGRRPGAPTPTVTASGRRPGRRSRQWSSARWSSSSHAAAVGGRSSASAFEGTVCSSARSSSSRAARDVPDCPADPRDAR